jgi:hypothetical protein
MWSNKKIYYINNKMTLKNATARALMRAVVTLIIRIFLAWTSIFSKYTAKKWLKLLVSQKQKQNINVNISID